MQKKQYDNISIRLKLKWNFVALYPKIKFWWGFRGRSPRKLMAFIHLQCSSTLKMTRFSMFWPCLYSMILHANWCNMIAFQYYSNRNDTSWFSIHKCGVYICLIDLCLPYTHEAKVRFKSLLTSNTVLVNVLLLFNFCCILWIPEIKIRKMVQSHITNSNRDFY